ncbi:hypothetical protein BDR26DRAFT_670564 [Obelidium mucronatum]|nr:hypothetical protein BDR26DRAFT_670564 [Obelidium mucronatum]
MSFASSPTSNWFSGNSGSPTLWTTNAYSYNPSAYSPAGETGDYWIDVSGLGGFDELLLVTGNRKYWVSFMVQDMPLGAYDKPFLASSTSKNFPEDLSYRNTYANAFYRSGVAQEPWISVGVVHAQNSEWMFWGEGKTNVHFNLLRQNNGGVLLLGRFLTRGFGAPKVSPTTSRREGTGSSKMYSRTKNFLNPGMNIGTAWDGPVKTSLAITSTEYFDASVTSTASTAFITTTTSTTTITFTTTTPTTATTTTSKTTTTSTATSTTTTSSATTTSRTTTSSTTTSSTTTTSKTTTSSSTGTSTTKTTTTITTATSLNLLSMLRPSPTQSFPAASANNQ